MIASLVDRLVRSQGWLDPVGEILAGVVGDIYRILGRPGKALKSLLHGTILGHALHPVLTDIPLGAWTVAIVADLVYLSGHASREIGDFCVFIGLLGALAAVATGYTDFHETFGHERRVATAHGLINTTVTILYLASWLMRWLGAPGIHTTAIVVSIVGYVLVLGGAYLGGDLVFAIGTMVNRNAFAEGPEKEYVDVGQPSDFEEGRMRKVEAGGMPVLVVRYGGRLCAIANTCSHAGGPLNEGKLRGDLVVCPLHASEFRITDGGVKGGPSTFDQLLLDVREGDGRVEVRLARSLHG